MFNSLPKGQSDIGLNRISDYPLGRPLDARTTEKMATDGHLLHAARRQEAGGAG